LPRKIDIGKEEKEQTHVTTLIQVARLYYEENLGQQEIANKLGVSRSLIAQYLQKAREQGIVQIEINDPLRNCRELSEELQKKAKLNYVEVIQQAHNSSQLTLRAVATKAAQYLEKKVGTSGVFGIASGRSVTEVIETLSLKMHRDSQNIDVVPLLGENSDRAVYTQVNQLVLKTANAIGGKPHFLFAPMVVGNAELRNALLQEEYMQSIVKMWEELDIVCVGIGVVPPTPGMIPYIGEEYIPDMIKAGAVGDVCGRYFDISGKVIECGFEDRIIGVEIKQLKKARNVVAIAHSSEKSRAVCGAIRSGIINTLFIDQSCARLVLKDL
jgi:DNA-binding transcriptional regulator LsrR (DeoR family)